MTLWGIFMSKLHRSAQIGFVEPDGFNIEVKNPQFCLNTLMFSVSLSVNGIPPPST